MSRNLALALSPLLLLAAAAAQQSTVVSPIELAGGLEGSTSNSYPFANTSAAPSRRYMQIHSDLVGTPMIVTRIACRMNGTATTYAGNAVADMELYMGDSLPYTQPSFVFANNYIGAPVLVMPRQNVNFVMTGSGTPAPFDFQMPLTTPFVYTGIHSLLWDVYVHSLTLVAPFPSQMDVESATTTPLANILQTGPGCTVAGQTSPMVMTVSGVDVPDTAGSVFTLGLTVDRAPANAPTLLAVGAQNLNLAVPGLCGNLYTDVMLLLVLGTTDGSGYLGTYNVGATTKVPGGTSCLSFPSLPGAVLYLQAHALDFTQTNPIQVSNSEGRQITLPGSNGTRVRKVSRLYNNIGGVTQPHSVFLAPNSLGYGLVTQFTF